MTNVGPGMTLAGRYRLDEHVAGGGMGDVWKGTDEVLGRTVAVKVLLAALVAEPGFAQRFREEARTMATINHPGVVNVYDYGSDQGVTYLIMEFIEGDALSKTLSRVGRLTPGRTMSLIAQAADALQAAHDKGIVHRDVKPANLMVRPNGTLVLTDFGIARSAQASQLTAVGSVLGTASYISPEQASGHLATAASDVYALGVVAYQCLSGRRPFEGGSPIEIALQHVDAVPPPLPPDIPGPVRTLVDRCLAKAPTARWPSAAALAAAARLAANGQSVPAAPVARPVSAAPASPGPVGPTSGAGRSGPAGTQVMPQQQAAPYRQPTYQQPVSAPRPAPYVAPRPVPERSRTGVVILGIVLAILVVALAALIASAVKRHHLQQLCLKNPSAAECRVASSSRLIVHLPVTVVTDGSSGTTLPETGWTVAAMVGPSSANLAGGS
jgi:eukaryotic-like serine/threonine-protein kinase